MPGSAPTASTIRDVARLAGVSVTTVSRVLNDPDRVRPEKRSAVERAISELSFRPNRSAQGLKGRRFGAVALVVGDITNMFFAEIASAIGEQFDLDGYNVLLCNFDNKESRLEKFLVELPYRGVDGVIICGSAFLESDRISPILQNLVASGIPMVLTGLPSERLTVPCVVSDSTESMAQLAEHLWARGRRTVGYMVGPSFSQMGVRRLAAFRTFAERRGLTLTEEVIRREVEFSFDAGNLAARSLVAAEPSIDALVCSGDQMALGAIEGLRQMGRAVPDDVAVIGFDDTALSRYTHPALTSVSSNIRETGRLAAQKLAQVIRGETTEMESRVACELVIRQSS